MVACTHKFTLHFTEVVLVAALSVTDVNLLLISISEDEDFVILLPICSQQTVGAGGPSTYEAEGRWSVVLYEHH